MIDGLEQTATIPMMPMRPIAAKERRAFLLYLLGAY